MGHELAAVGRMEQLDVLQAGHERHRPGRRSQRVQRHPDGGVPDGMDLRRDAAGGRPTHELGQSRRLGQPHAASSVRREGSVRFRFDVGQERRGTRTERSIGKALHPADPRAAVRVTAQPKAALQATLEGRVKSIIAQRGEDPDR